MSDLKLKYAFTDRGGSKVYDVSLTLDYPDGVEFATNQLGQVRIPPDPRIAELEAENSFHGAAAMERKRYIEKLEAQINRECKWQKQNLGTGWEYDSWATSCGEDYAILEEWDETPPPYCGHCGGKAVDITPKDSEVDDE